MHPHFLTVRLIVVPTTTAMVLMRLLGTQALRSSLYPKLHSHQQEFNRYINSNTDNAHADALGVQGAVP